MSHVADGILHAYLDGALDALGEAGELPDGATAADVRAHLAACADCRTRLETERAVRESAGVVLSDASLSHVDVPEFTGVESPRRPRRTAWVPLGWAASVLLAVGAGWLGSEAWRAERSGGVALEQTSSQAAPPNAPQPQAPRPNAPQSQAAFQAPTQGPDGSGARADADEPAIEAPAIAEGTGATQSAEPVVAATLAAPPARELPRPIGVPLNDPRREGLRSDARSLEQIVVTGAAAPPASPVPQSFTTAEPPLTEASRVLESRAAYAQKSPVIRNVGEMAAFDSVLAREKSGRLHFAPVESPLPREIDDQVFLVAGASAPAIEVARELGQTMVRVRQTLPGGERVEIVSWRPDAVSFDALVMTGVRAGMRSDARAREAAPPQVAAAQAEVADRGAVLAVMSPSARRRDDGRRELMLRSGASVPVWIAVRADMSDSELRALVRRLTTR